MNIYVSNLDQAVTKELLAAAFATYGTVVSSKLIRDHATGVSRGFGFIEMDDVEGEKAMNILNGSVLEGRKISAKRANDRNPPKGTLIERLRGY